jgi:hypothetical protein
MKEALLTFSGSVPRDPAVELWLDERASDLGMIARNWFARMRECGDDVRELVHDGCPVACVDEVPFAYVNVFNAHVNVGFFCGAFLPDPAGLLEGSGKRMRHVKVRPGSEPDPVEMGALIERAYRDIKSRLASPASARHAADER